METTTLKLYSLGYKQARTYFVALLFMVGNIVLPQLCHLVPHGGVMLLPIYFFTLVAAYKYGWRAGLLTALLSPIVNHLLFGMPAAAVLPAILSKSVLLALMAGMAAAHFRRVTIPAVALVVVAYQAVGTLVEWALTGSLYVALQDVRVGFVGMLLQIVAGTAVIKYLCRK